MVGGCLNAWGVGRVAMVSSICHSLTGGRRTVARGGASSLHHGRNVAALTRRREHWIGRVDKQNNQRRVAALEPRRPGRSYIMCTDTLVK